MRLRNPWPDASLSSMHDRLCCKYAVYMRVDLAPTPFWGHEMGQHHIQLSLLMAPEMFSTLLSNDQGARAAATPPRSPRVTLFQQAANEPQIGRILPLVSRAVCRATMPEIDHADVDYNVVQNNGPGAAQVVPHVRGPPAAPITRPPRRVPPKITHWLSSGLLSASLTVDASAPLDPSTRHPRHHHDI
jgi:hypothetical protein